jgi:hypothetical protein
MRTYTEGVLIAELLPKLAHRYRAWTNSGFMSTMRSWLFSSFYLRAAMAALIIAWTPSWSLV